MSLPEHIDLTGRTAACTCGRTAPSSRALGFFIYRGPGNTEHGCAVCGYYPSVHDDTPEHIARRSTWTPHAWQHAEHGTDLFYCGCRGWD